MTALNILVGLTLLLFGRRLFWIFVGAAGFIAGMVLTQELFAGQSSLLVLVVAVFAGVIGAVLSVLLQKIAIAVGGFLIGGYILMSFSIAVGNQSFAWVAYLIGGVVGAVLVLILFDWALILLSSLAGAVLISQSIGFDQVISVVVFVVAAVAGIVIQSMQLRRAPRPAPPEQAVRETD